MVPGYAQGDYPEWLRKSALEWFPPELIEKYTGSLEYTMLNGEALNFLPAGPRRSRRICVRWVIGSNERISISRDDLTEQRHRRRRLNVAACSPTTAERQRRYPVQMPMTRTRPASPAKSPALRV